MLTSILSFFFLCCIEPKENRLPYYKSADFTPQWLDEKELPVDFHRVPAFELTNHHGHPCTEKELDGTITVVDFFFTFCPGICPTLTKNMANVASSFPNDERVLFLSHSVTPKHDTVEKLRQYAEDKNITASNWHLLTGDREQIYSLGRKVYFAEENLGKQKSKDDFLHTENFILVDQNRHLRGIYNGLNKASVRQLIEDIQILLNEK